MRRIRIIPVLLIKNKGLYKTIKFGKPNYIGDPINALKIFNDKEVDEILILDIEASQSGKEPNYQYIRSLCGEAFIPLGYGGGVTNIDQATKIFQAGAEKVVLNSVLQSGYGLISEIAAKYGSQSAVVCLDYKKKFMGGYKPHFRSGGESSRSSLLEFAKDCENAGAGEIILQSIEKDGTFSGLDMETIHEVAAAVSIPLIACGGLNSLSNAREAIKSGASAVAAGSYFVYKNNDVRSILINYPNQETLTKEIFTQVV